MLLFEGGMFEMVVNGKLGSGRVACSVFPFPEKSFLPDTSLNFFKFNFIFSEYSVELLHSLKKLSNYAADTRR